MYIFVHFFFAYCILFFCYRSSELLQEAMDLLFGAPIPPLSSHSGDQYLQIPFVSLNIFTTRCGLLSLKQKGGKKRKRYLYVTH